MKFSVSTLSALLFLGTLSVGGSALAGGDGYDVRLGVQPTFGFVGEMTQKNGGSDDFEATAGLSVFGEFKVHENVALGGVVSFLWWNLETWDRGNADPSFWVDLNARVRVLVPLLDDDLELYLAVPIGMNLGVLSDDVSTTAETGVGFNFSVLAGGLYNIWDQLDIFIEMGATYHWTKYEFKNGADAEFSGAQMAFNFGGAWRF